MPIIQPTPAKITMAALVRDKHGNPRIDDPKNCPIEILNLLTPAEREALSNGNHNNNSNT